MSPPRTKQESDPPALAAELRSVFGLLKRRLREQGGFDDLTASQIAALGRLEREGACTSSALARAEGVRQQSMAAIVSALVERGFVAGTADPSDGRQTILNLTPAAHAWFATGRAFRQDWLTRIIARELAGEELDDLAHGLTLLRRLAES